MILFLYIILVHVVVVVLVVHPRCLTIVVVVAVIIVVASEKVDSAGLRGVLLAAVNFSFICCLHPCSINRICGRPIYIGILRSNISLDAPLVGVVLAPPIFDAALLATWLLHMPSLSFFASGYHESL